MSCGYKTSSLSRTPPVPSMTWYGALVEYIEISDCSKAEAAQSRPFGDIGRASFPQACSRGHTRPHEWRSKDPTSLAKSAGEMAHGRGCVIPDTNGNRAARCLAWWECDVPCFCFCMILENENQALGLPFLFVCWTARCGARALGGWKPPLHPALLVDRHHGGDSDGC